MSKQPLRNRRTFLTEVGRGTLIATIGYGLTRDMGMTSALGEETENRLNFGPLEPLVAMMQETPADRLMPAAIEKLRSGTSLRDLLAAAALANARTFGGEDYVGFHTVMALAPAYHMAMELQGDRQALPVLKVLYRNSNRIQEFGGPSKEVLRPIAAGDGPLTGEALRAAVRAKDLDTADSRFVAICRAEGTDPLDALLFAVGDNTEVHRTVLPYRAYDLLGLIGHEHAETLLRQSVHYCVKSERDYRHTEQSDRPRKVLPELLDRYKLLGSAPAPRAADDAWVDSLSRTIFEGSAESAAEAAAVALSEGYPPAAIGEAISLAANQLVLRDAGRPANQTSPGKPAGSVHGDSIGVHACDSANAWHNMALACKGRNQAACLILGAFQVADDRVNRGGDFLHWSPRPLNEDVEPLKSFSPSALPGELDSAIRDNDQGRACAVVARWNESGGSERPILDVLLKFATTEDGALHAEKYYRTVCEEFASSRPAFRGRQLVALARVTASEFGRPAPGVAEATSLLKV
jgi:hypothetical protein